MSKRVVREATVSPHFGEPQHFDWHQAFRSGMAVAEVQRSGLVKASCAATHRWVHLHGIPGLGKTTVLEQIARELTTQGQPFVALWEPRDMPDLGIAELLAGRSADDSTPVTLLLDDFDWLLDDGRATQIFARVAEDDSLRVVSVGLDALSLPDTAAHIDVQLFGVSRLVFNERELREFCEEFVAQNGGTAPRLGQEDIAVLERTTGGVPAAVAIGVDRWYAPVQHQIEAFNYAIMLQYLKRIIETQYPVSIVENGDNGFTRKLSLMPRFTERHVQLLAPASKIRTLSENAALLSLSLSDTARVGEHAWSRSTWEVLLQWNAGSRALRLDLVAALLHVGEHTAAFDQLILASEYGKAELLLHEHFFTIYEEFAPEVEAVLRFVAPSKLSKTPYLRFFLLLLRNDASCEAWEVAAHNFRVAEDKLAISSRPKDVQARALSMSLRALVLARLERLQEATELARQAIGLAPSSEGAVIATLVCFTAGVWPSTQPQFEIHHQDGSISANKAILFTLAHEILRTRASRGEREVTEPVLPSVVSLATMSTAHRYLLPLQGRLFTEAERWQHLGQEFEVYGIVNGQDVPLLMRQLFATVGQIHSATFSAPDFVKQQRELPSPLADIAETVIYLQAGDFEKAVRPATQVISHWGGRIDALAGLLLGISCLRRGMFTQVRSVLSVACETGFLKFALRCIPVSMVRDLAPYNSQLQSDLNELLSSGRDVLESGPRLTAKLTGREREVLSLLQQGLTDKQISERVFISVSTTKTHLQSVSKKLGVRGRKQIIARAEELGL